MDMNLQAPALTINITKWLVYSAPTQTKHTDKQTKPLNLLDRNNEVSSYMLHWVSNSLFTLADKLTLASSIWSLWNQMEM